MKARVRDVPDLEMLVAADGPQSRFKATRDPHSTIRPSRFVL